MTSSTSCSRAVGRRGRSGRSLGEAAADRPRRVPHRRRSRRDHRIRGERGRRRHDVLLRRRVVRLLAAVAPAHREHRPRSDPGDVLAHGTGDRTGPFRPDPRTLRREVDRSRDDRPRHRERHQRRCGVRRHRGERRAPRRAAHRVGADRRARGLVAGGVLQLPLRRARPVRARARVPRLPDLGLHPAPGLAGGAVGTGPVDPEQSLGTRFRPRARRHDDHALPALLHAGVGGGQRRRPAVRGVRARRRLPRRGSCRPLRVLHHRGHRQRAPSGGDPGDVRRGRGAGPRSTRGCARRPAVRGGPLRRVSARRGHHAAVDVVRDLRGLRLGVRHQQELSRGAGVHEPVHAAHRARRERRAHPRHLADHRYVALSDGQIGRILLVDLATGASTEVVTARGAPARPYYMPPFSESGDGKLLLVGAVGPAERSALYLVDVAAGRTTLLYEDDEIWSIGPLRGVVSPDGARYAFHGHDGVRIGDTTGGHTRLFVEDEDPADMAKIWYPLAWSLDRSAIALAQGTESVTRVGAFRAANGEQYWTGTGSQVSWRTKAPFLAVAGSAGTFAGENRVYAVDPNDGQVRDLEPLGAKFYGSIAWHPNADRVLYTAADDLFAERDVYTRALADDAPKRVESPKKIWDAWRSSDGSKIYATAARGATVGAPGVGDFDILELPGGRVVASICGTSGRCR